MRLEVLPAQQRVEQVARRAAPRRSGRAARRRSYAVEPLDQGRRREEDDREQDRDDVHRGPLEPISAAVDGVAQLARGSLAQPQTARRRPSAAACGGYAAHAHRPVRVERPASSSRSSVRRATLDARDRRPRRSTAAGGRRARPASRRPSASWSAVAGASASPRARQASIGLSRVGSRGERSSRCQPWSGERSAAERGGAGRVHGRSVHMRRACAPRASSESQDCRPARKDRVKARRSRR